MKSLTPINMFDFFKRKKKEDKDYKPKGHDLKDKKNALHLGKQSTQGKPLAYESELRKIQREIKKLNKQKNDK